METSEIADGVLNGRSSLLGAMGWMFGLSFVLTLFLGWVPLIGPFIGPAVGGFIGGRRAGSPGTAVLAAVLPAVLLTLLMFRACGHGGALVPSAYRRSHRGNCGRSDGCDHYRPQSGFVFGSAGGRCHPVTIEAA